MALSSVIALNLTLAARASRICLTTSPRLGAGTSMVQESADQIYLAEHLLRKIWYASRARSSSSHSSGTEAVLTRASSSPVVGHVEATTSPEPCHRPSYTP